MPARFDRGELRKPTKLPNGFLKAEGYLTRTGVFLYRKSDGSIRRELRLAEEVFHPDAVASFDLAPLTNDHPPEMVTAENVKKYAVGTVAEPKRDDDHLRGVTMLYDRDAISDAIAGKVELSCGYTCELEEKTGVTERGEKYDAIQRKIRGNHVAIVTAGRAGPSARLRMDASDAVMVQGDNAHNPPGPGTEELTVKRKIKINGVPFEVEEQVAEAFDAHEKAHVDALTTAEKAAAEAKKLADTASAKADAAADKLKKIEQEHKDAVDPAKLQDRVKARVALERTAADVLGDDAKLDDLTDRQIKEKVLEELTSFKADAKKSDEYVQARFDAAVEDFNEDAEDDKPVNRARKAVEDRADADDEREDSDDEDEDRDDEDDDRFDAAAAREKMIKEHRNAHLKAAGAKKQ